MESSGHINQSAFNTFAPSAVNARQTCRGAKIKESGRVNCKSLAYIYFAYNRNIWTITYTSYTLHYFYKIYCLTSVE